MSITSTPPGNGQALPVDPDVVQQPPGHGSGPPDIPPQVARPRWYRRGWVIGLVALLVGIGLGAAAGFSKKAPRAATVTAPAQTVIHTVPGATKTLVHVRTVASPTRTVAGPTQTVTQTVQATPTPTTTSGGGGGNNFTGTDTQNLGNHQRASGLHAALDALGLLREQLYYRQ